MVRLHLAAGVLVPVPFGDNLLRGNRRRRSDGRCRRSGSRVGVELPQSVAEMVEIHDGQAAAAARTFRLRLQINRRAAARARDRHELLLERIHFRGRQAANQALAPKELEKRHEDAVMVRTPEVPGTCRRG